MAETEFKDVEPAVAHEYVWFGGQPLAQISSTGTIDWYFNDHLGTPILQTDASAQVTWREEYEPYGEVFAFRAGAAKHQPLRFPGQESDGASELSYNIFRWYRGAWGRYTQADPIGIAADKNLYRYARNNSVRFIDRLGLAPNAPCGPPPEATGRCAADASARFQWNLCLYNAADDGVDAAVLVFGIGGAVAGLLRGGPVLGCALGVMGALGGYVVGNLVFDRLDEARIYETYQRELRICRAQRCGEVSDAMGCGEGAMP
jgi:RHS repeat-associated protein